MTAEQILKAVDETVPSEKYMEEVERLKGATEIDIRESWENATPLFSYVEPKPFSEVGRCGCLTMIKNNGISVATAPSGKDVDEKLTTAIKSDELLPEEAGSIGDGNLYRFAQWQTYLDKYYGREAQ